MSLINEALKRAEADKRNNTPSVSNELPLSPVTPLNNTPRWGLRILVLGIVFVVICAASWVFVSMIAPPTIPERAVAQKPPPTFTLRPRPRARSSTGRPTAGAKSPAHANSSRRFDDQIELAFAKTLDALRYYQPPDHPAREDSTRPEVKDTESPAVATTEQTTPTGEVGAGERDAMANTAPVALATASPKPPSFKLSAIFRGPAGVTAIINGRFVQLGSSVDGAKVMKINRHTVELELDGKTLTIQM